MTTYSVVRPTEVTYAFEWGKMIKYIRETLQKGSEVYLYVLYPRLTQGCAKGHGVYSISQVSVYRTIGPLVQNVTHVKSDMHL